MTTVKLVSSDCKQFLVYSSIAKQSLTVSRLLETVEDEGAEIPLPNVSSRTLEKVIEWCEANDDDKQNGKILEIRNEDLFELIVAANYLDIANLLDSSCRAVAEMFKDESRESIRKTFGIVNDLTPDEERQIEKENTCFNFPQKPCSHFASPPVQVQDSEESVSVFRLLDLPNEIISIILQQLNIIDRFRARVCQRLYLLELVARYPIKSIHLILVNGATAIDCGPEKLTFALSICHEESSFPIILESCVEFLRNIASKGTVETLTMDKSFNVAISFDAMDLVSTIQSIPTRELTIDASGLVNLSDQSLNDWTLTRESLYLPRTKLTGLRLYRLFNDMSNSLIPLRRFRISASCRALTFLLSKIGITIRENRFVSTNADVKIYAQISMFFGSKYFFLIGKNMLITTDGGILQETGELWFERHNDDGSMPDLPCFKADIPISYILNECDQLTVTYE